MGRVVTNNAWEKINRETQLKRFFVACDEEHRNTDFIACDYILVGRKQSQGKKTTRLQVCWSTMWDSVDRIPWHCTNTGSRLPLWLYSERKSHVFRDPKTGITTAKPLKTKFVRSKSVVSFLLHESSDHQLVVGYRFNNDVLYFPAPVALQNALVKWAIKNNRLLRYPEKTRLGPKKQNNNNNVIPIQNNIS